MPEELQPTPEAHYVVDFAPATYPHYLEPADVHNAMDFATWLRRQGYAFTNTNPSEAVRRYGCFHVNIARQLVMVGGRGNYPAEHPWFCQAQDQTADELKALIELPRPEYLLQD